MAGRQYYLDNLKVFLTVLVIFHHAGQAYGNGGGWAYTPSNPAERALFAERPPIYFAGEQRHFSCNAVFSNLPLRNITVHNFECNQGVKLLYSSTNKAEYYYYITAELVVGTETVHFVFTHLAFDEDRSPDTVCQAQIAELIDLYRDVDNIFKFHINHWRES